MSKFSRLIIVTMVGFCFGIGHPLAQTLSLPDNLIDFNSKQGSRLLLDSEPFVLLAPQHPF